MATDSHIVFADPRAAQPPTPLVFGGSVLEVPSSSATIAFKLDGVTVDAFIALPDKFSGAFTLGGVMVTANVFYDNRVINWLDVRAQNNFEAGVQSVIDETAKWSPANPARDGQDLRWSPTTTSQKAATALHAIANSNRTASATEWGLGAFRTAFRAEGYQTSVAHETLRSILWQLGISNYGMGVSGRMQTAVPNGMTLRDYYKVAAAKQAVALGFIGTGIRSGRPFNDMLWGTAIGAPAGVHPPPPPVVVVPPYYGPWGSHILFECPPLAFPYLVFGGTSPCDIVGPEVPGLVIVPIRRVYMILNNASLRRVDGNIYLPTFNMSLTLDVDSWTWGFSASLPGDTLTSLEPSAAGAPVEVEAMVNGVAYRALVESIGRSREFGKSDIKIGGRGKTALLDAPYAPVMNFRNASDRTAQQIMDDTLSVNNVSMGWSVNWGLEDWLVPAGVFTHQGSYITALNQIAAAAGGYVQPHATGQALSVLPRYPSGPWTWGGVTPDYELPSDVTTREGIEWVEKARYNRVYASGVQQGVLGQITRQGTAGDLLAPMVTDSLITTAGAARQRGLSILSNTGRVANVSLRLPVLAETGVITPGKMVRYVDAGVTRVGIVRSVGVEVGLPEIWQNLGVETHVN